MAHGDITRMEWKVVYNRAGGFGRGTEWFATREAVDSSWIVRDGLEIVSITHELRILHF